ncbi:ABC transporter permease [uncultured Oxalicibacterium sp.]|uniref:MlaE family ABC transporter permease n=1 Tax=uncultured Oxalicibacterium sp. TaxID=1168540 RepID=UPI0025FE17F7|nr:ABC transporter permease [uncultured Oxalicibacterium sp.]
MTVKASPIATLFRMSHPLQRWLAGSWRTLLFGVTMLSLLFSPGSYRRENRRAVAYQIVLGTNANLIWFTVLTALLSLILIRIVVVTAVSYGLSRYALEMVVRVLVLELIPLTAALFIALRRTLPDGVELAEMRARGELHAMQARGFDPIRLEFFPRAVAGIFSVLMLAALSCILSLILAYVSIYGFNHWALPGYTRIVGQIFNPAVTMIFVLKTLFFSLAVSLIPIASSLYTQHRYPYLHPLNSRSKAANELAAMVRLFFVLLLIEIASLMGNYY